MSQYLVIVESPAKVKTIKKFLGKNYTVTASNGHIRDLPKSQLGVDTDNDFEPKYITIRGKGDLLSSLKKQAKKADKVLLATDPDREGEAISWHLMNSLGVDDKKFARITFNEITQTAVKESLKHKRALDMNLVDAQQTRRILDRLVGYKISPLLWAKVKRGLSAGRVQSAALEIISRREEEINAFIPEEYWTLDALIEVGGEKKPVTAKFYGDSTGRLKITDAKMASDIKKAVEKAQLKVIEVKRGKRTKNPPLPFTTSTLQQEASSSLGFTTQKTMRVAQQLYEGVSVAGRPATGLISYLRTDSVRVSDDAKDAASKYISHMYGDEYNKKSETGGKSAGKIQDAHEAIRPTDLYLDLREAKDSLSKDQMKLYLLIRTRFLASRMSAASYDTLSVKVAAGDYVFTISASCVAFEGFLAAYKGSEKKEDENVLLNDIDENTALKLKKLEDTQHFTQPPDRYTEASLVRAMEEMGIGRPSTYAPTITTLLSRRYVTKEEKKLFITEIGEAVNNIMKDSFPDIVDPGFTAQMESRLDEVEQGNMEWKQVVRDFYPSFEKELEAAEKELEKVEIKDEVTDVICDKCGRNMVIKYGPHGKFLACPGFPECRNTKPFQEKAGVKCPKCGKEVLIKRTKKGRRYYGCQNNPECDFMSWQKPVEEKCPVCGQYMIERGKKIICSDKSCGYMKES